MPSSSEILDGLTTVALEWRPVAIGWHGALAMFGAAIVLGWRPSKRLAGFLLLSPFMSVSALAWVSGNPFNGVTLVALATALAAIARRLPVGSVQIGSGRHVGVGAVLVAFGWVYPHFVDVSWTSYAVAAPLGLIPCPSLSAVVGLTLIFDLLRSRPWSLTLATFGIVYGVIGALALGVRIDFVLLAGSVVLGFEASRADALGLRRPPNLSWPATP
jgi:hypothetical protein